MQKLLLPGVALSYGPDLAAGLTIILLVGGVYILSVMLAEFIDRCRPRSAAQGAWQGATGE